MKSMLIRIGMIAGLMLMMGSTVVSNETDRYWEWGWGTYGTGSLLDDARFDWSLVNYPDEKALVRCNEILKLNPKHKFLIRVWPILGLGDCPENRQQATFLHYAYVPSIRKKVLARINEQLGRFMTGLSRKESLVGSVFLEELPCHFSAAPFRGDWTEEAKRWGIEKLQDGRDIPWDVKRFQKEIERELGESFSLASEASRRWWGKKYIEVFDEIHRAMKKATNGKPVLYWHQTMFNTLDHLKEGETLFKPGVVPISYKDILKPGVCDGIFGYPNSPMIWAKQTQTVVSKYHCLLFSQLAQCPYLRLSRFKEQVKLARWKNPGNLGTFLYPDHGRRKKAWNQLSYPENGAYWTIAEYARRFAWDHRVGLDVVKRCLIPSVQFNYNMNGLKKGQFAHVQAIIHNPRSPSWYGGDADRAVMKDLKATLTVPEGFSIPLQNNAGKTLDVGSLGPLEYQYVDWWVRIEQEKAVMPKGKDFRILAQADGVRSMAKSTAMEVRIPCFGIHKIHRSGETWIEPGFHIPKGYTQAVMLKPLKIPIIRPQLRCEDRFVIYRDTLKPDEYLVIGPDDKARLFLSSQFNEKTRCFGSRQVKPEEAVAFTTGYMVYGTPSIPVEAGMTYKIRVSGWAKDGGNAQVIIRFSGKKQGKRKTVDISVIGNAFGETLKTIEKEVKVPTFDRKSCSARIFFYRAKSKGTVYYREFDFKRIDIPEDGIDVSNRMEGILPSLETPYSVWEYRDLSLPCRYGKAKIEIRFLPPEEIHR